MAEKKQTKKTESKAASKAKAKVDFAWYKAGQEIKQEDAEHIEQWKAEGLVE